MIGLLVLQNGEAINTSIAPQAWYKDLIRRHERQIRMLPAGEYHNITPAKYTKRHFDYSLTVNADGTGVIHQIARYRNSAIQRIQPDGSLSRPSHGDKEWRLPLDANIVPIVGANDKNQPTLWVLIVYVPGARRKRKK